MNRVVVIGAGIGGLTTAAVLAKAGCDVTVLEAHIYPGGSAGTFYHQGYRFDAGATLAGGFYPGGPMDIVARQAGLSGWPGQAHDPAMVVHLPDGAAVPRFGSEQRHAVRKDFFGPQAGAFFGWQEATADAMWDLALQLPAWPVQNATDLGSVLAAGLAWLRKPHAERRYAGLLLDLFRSAAHHLPAGNERLRQFIDGQLLISSQTTSRRANALYAASALDLPRRGVRHLPGGMGAIAESLVEAVRSHGGRVFYRQPVSKISLRRGRPAEVTTRRGEVFPADIVAANLTPWNIRDLLGEDAPTRLQRLPARPERGWGAFVLYLGIDEQVLPPGAVLHHQVIAAEPLAETNSVFISVSPSWDTSRAPAGKRAVTISTHTNLGPWWRLFENDRPAYEALKASFIRQTLVNAEKALPGLQGSVDLLLPGTPVTFQRFTRRHSGWVGGFPQTSLFQAWGPRLADRMWMVGDSIFPGQSTAAVALGGLRVAREILQGVSEQRLTEPGDAYALSGD